MEIKLLDYNFRNPRTRLSAVGRIARTVQIFFDDFVVKISIFRMFILFLLTVEIPKVHIF